MTQQEINKNWALNKKKYKDIIPSNLVDRYEKENNANKKKHLYIFNSILLSEKTFTNNAK